MLYNLRNGSTVSIPVERYLEMTDEDLERLELYHRGAEINDPFFASVLSKKSRQDEEDTDSVDIPIDEVLDDEGEEE